jgi:signal transduction histidine kinase
MTEEQIRVLYIDDEVQNLNLFKACFRHDFQIFLAKSAGEGVAHLEQQDIHVIVSDQKMPGITGVQFFESILEKYPDPVRILLTAYTDAEALIDAINKGQIFRYLRKPWEEEDLRMTIRSAFQSFSTNRRLLEQNAELQKRNDELNRFVYSASHDLKAPLGSIQGILDLSKMEGEEDNASQYLLLIEKSVKQLEAFIHNIIQYYKNTQLKEQIDQIDFQKMVAEILESYKYYQFTPLINFRIEILQEEPFFGDTFRIRTILNNLLSNAIKYQRRDEPDKFVMISVKTSPEEVLIRVEDNGIGIPAEHLSQIYNMFFRATSENSGSGMGLYILNEALSKISGKIKVSSHLDAGTTFELILPNRSDRASLQNESVLSTPERR